MKSYVKGLYNYMAEPFQTVTESVPREEMQFSLDNAIQTALLQHRVFTQVDTVALKDTVTVRLQSAVSRFQKEELPLTVGLGLFSEKLETAMIGRGVGSTFSLLLEGENVEVTIKECKRLTIPTLTDEFVKSLDMDGIGNVAEYKDYLWKQYEELYHSGYVTWYALQLLSDTIKKCQWEIDEAEMEEFCHRWSEVQQEERDFHNTEIVGEYEEQEREDAVQMFYTVLIYCLYSGEDYRTFTIDLSDSEALGRIQKKVLAPFERYLKDKITIVTEEEE